MRIALIAHDAKKKLMQNFCIAYRGILSRHKLYATSTTGRLIEEVTSLTIHKHLAGHLGGMQQIGAQIEPRSTCLFSCAIRSIPRDMSRTSTMLLSFAICTISRWRQILRRRSC